MRNKAVILDRDGTIIVEKNYLHKPEDLEIISGVAAAISKMNALGYKVIVITNQSGIARGYYTERDMHALHAHLQTLLAAENAHIDAFYYCPHHQEASLPQYRKDCDCRKPKTGLFERAIVDFSIDTENSWAVGDRARDLQPGARLGMKTALVLTGYGACENPSCADIAVADLREFAQQLS